MICASSCGEEAKKELPTTELHEAPWAADSHVTKGQQGGRTDAHKSYGISAADPFRSVGALLAAMQLPLVGGA